MPVKILWFSRHILGQDQLAGLIALYGDDLQVTQVDKTIQSASELTPYILESDVIALVAPMKIQQQVLKLAGSRPVIFSESKRLLSEDGGKTLFKFNGWYQIKRIEYEVTRLI